MDFPRINILLEEIPLKKNKTLLLSALLLLAPTLVQAALIGLSATLGAANQNGSDPARIVDPLGAVPTTASGTLSVQLDTVANTLDYQLSVEGILRSELRNFGPNATPIHLHLASGDRGNFGPIAVDLTQNLLASEFTDTATGFTLARTGISILLADQGNVALGMHPGDALIVPSLLSGNAFVLVHTTKNIFTNTPPGRPAGFPFGEIRGNLIPVAATLPLFGLGLMGLGLSRKAGPGKATDKTGLA